MSEQQENYGKFVARMSQDEKYKRSKLIKVDPRKILSLFLGAKAISSITRCSFQDVPEDSELLMVQYDHDTDSFAFTVHHPSFEELLPGEEPSVADKCFNVVFSNPNDVFKDVQSITSKEEVHVDV